MPAGSEPDVEVTVRVATVMMMLKFVDVFCCGVPESETETVTLYVPPDPPGVPVIAPVLELMLNPGGSEEPSCAVHDQV